MKQKETHKTHRAGWLRAAVLGANDGIVSTSSLILGVAAAGATSQSILVAGVAALVAGAMSMAAGEYVSVSSQADTEKADLAIEKQELKENPDFELAELAAIYVKRGLDADLAAQVASQLTAHNALAAHSRDELGITEALAARPIQAAVSSALTFTIGAFVPIVVVYFLPQSLAIEGVAVSSLCCLILLGFLSARAGGAPAFKAITRITFWGASAMALTAFVGSLFGIVA